VEERTRAAAQEEVGSVAPYKVLPEVVREVKAVMVERLMLFNGKS